MLCSWPCTNLHTAMQGGGRNRHHGSQAGAHTDECKVHGRGSLQVLNWMLEVWLLQQDNTRLSSSAPHSAQLLLNTSIKFYNGPICGYHWTRTSRTAQPRPSTENGNYGNLIMENGKRKLTHLYVRAGPPRS